MDQNFQTSFIPKKPIVEERATSSKPVGILLIASILILFIVLLGTGGLYFYKVSLNNKIKGMQASLNSAENEFEPSKLAELQLLDKRLIAATSILDNHISITPIFTELGNITMHTIRYSTFNYTMGSSSATADASVAVAGGGNNSTDSNNIDVKMSGIAIDYRSIALESDLFSQDKNFINPIFSNLTIDSSGNISFDLEFSVAPSFVNYKQTLAGTQS
jgi:hypothetical protein